MKRTFDDGQPIRRESPIRRQMLLLRLSISLWLSRNQRDVRRQSVLLLLPFVSRYPNNRLYHLRSSLFVRSRIDSHLFQWVRGQTLRWCRCPSTHSHFRSSWSKLLLSWKKIKLKSKKYVYCSSGFSLDLDRISLRLDCHLLLDLLRRWHCLFWIRRERRQAQLSQNTKEMVRYRADYNWSLAYRPLHLLCMCMCAMGVNGKELNKAFQNQVFKNQ